MQTLDSLIISIVDILYIFFALLTPYLVLVGVIMLLYYGFKKIKTRVLPSQNPENSEQDLEPKKIYFSENFWRYFVLGFAIFIFGVIGFFYVSGVFSIHTNLV